MCEFELRHHVLPAQPSLLSLSGTYTSPFFTTPFSTPTPNRGGVTPEKNPRKTVRTESDHLAVLLGRTVEFRCVPHGQWREPESARWRPESAPRVVFCWCPCARRPRGAHRLVRRSVIRQAPYRCNRSLRANAKKSSRLSDRRRMRKGGTGMERTCGNECSNFAQVLCQVVMMIHLVQ